jgi:hypothetical protein
MIEEYCLVGIPIHRLYIHFGLYCILDGSFWKTPMVSGTIMIHFIEKCFEEIL